MRMQITSPSTFGLRFAHFDAADRGVGVLGA